MDNYNFQNVKKSKKDVTGKSRRVVVKDNEKLKQQLIRRELNPKQTAAIDLANKLEKYPIDKQRRNILKNEFVELDVIISMNMECLAAAIYMIEQIDDKNSDIASIIKPQYFLESFLPFRMVMDKLSNYDSDSDKTIRKRKEVILTYMTTIILFRLNNINKLSTEYIEENVGTISDDFNDLINDVQPLPTDYYE